jgi:ribosomal protein S3
LSISSISKLTFIKNISIRVISLCKYSINANIIGQFFSIRLQQYYTIWEIFKNIKVLFKKLMFTHNVLKGYKIIFSGRFSRKQRTTYSWKNFGTLGPATVKSKLDYSNTVIPLRYSLCSIKVWICLKNKNINTIDFII